MNRFDLEDKIIDTKNTIEELDVLARMVLNEEIDKDSIANTLYGIKMLHEGRVNKLFDTFCQVFKLDQYSNLAEEVEVVEDNSTTEYRILEEDEIIEEGDEYNPYGNVWELTKRAGLRACVKGWYRRPIIWT
jgi:hypothetical protein